MHLWLIPIKISSMFKNCLQCGGQLKEVSEKGKKTEIVCVPCNKVHTKKMLKPKEYIFSWNTEARVVYINADHANQAIRIAENIDELTLSEFHHIVNNKPSDIFYRDCYHDKKSPIHTNPFFIKKSK